MEKPEQPDLSRAGVGAGLKGSGFSHVVLARQVVIIEWDSCALSRHWAYEADVNIFCQHGPQA